jgi:hypothetical protein
VLTNQPCWRNGSAQDFYPIVLDRPVILRLWVRAPRGAVLFAPSQAGVLCFGPEDGQSRWEWWLMVIWSFCRILRIWWVRLREILALRNPGPTCQDFDHEAVDLTTIPW